MTNKENQPPGKKSKATTPTAEADLLRSLNSEQLQLVLRWLKEKAAQYKNASACDRPSALAQLTVELSLSIGTASYQPSEEQMIESIHHIAQRLENCQIPRAAKKLRLAGNFIPRHDRQPERDACV